MTTHQEAIWRIADKLRSRPERVTPAMLLKECRDEGVPTSLDELALIVTRFERCLDHFVPKEVASFIANIVEYHSPKRILDPWAGMGFLPIPLHGALSPQHYEAYSSNHAHSEVWEQLEGTDGITFHIEDGLTALTASKQMFDAVVSCPPWGLQAKKSLMVEIAGEQVEVKDDYGHLLMLESCRHLSPGGIAVFIVGGAFFFNSGQPGKARHTLAALGFRPTAAIELPAGTFAPLTNIPTHIVVLQHTEDDQLFTGRFSKNEKHQQTLLKNIRERIEGKTPDLGRVVDIESFQGFTPIELSERLQESAKRNGLIAYPFDDVVLELNTPSPSKDFDGFDEKPNAVYLPQMASTAATSNQERLPEKLKSYFQLVINSDVAEAEFLAGLLNTPFGQLWRDTLRSGTTIPRIGKTSLEKSTIFLPPPKSRDIQEKVVDCQHQLVRLRNEINELESQLWKRPVAVKTVEAKIQTINRKDRLEDWLDSLPFPLASILWSCHTQSGSLKEQYERKIHFFEALSEFLGIIYLSAFSENKAIWAEQREALKAVLSKGKLSLEMATFGTWKAIVELFSKYGRSLLNNDEELVFELFKTRNREVLEALMSRKLVSLLQSTNKIRNDWQGHTGIVSDRDAKNVDEMLLQHFQTLRETFGLVWEGYELLLPGNCKYRDGLFQFNTKKVMGTRTPFPIESISVAEAMEDGHLYLKSPDESRGLKLLPLIKIMPSPRTAENACYFYNRRQSDGIRFLSYYFEADAEVVDEFGDVAQTLSNLVSERHDA